MLPHLPCKDKLTLLFCLVDDFLWLLPTPTKALPSGSHLAGRHPKLTSSAVLTLALFRFWPNQRHYKAFYQMLYAMRP
jgi:hypothetical protein